MKHYKKSDDSVHAFDSDYEGELITNDMVLLTDAELASLRTPPFSALREVEFNKYRAQRATALDKLAGMTAAALALGENSKAATLATLRQGLLDLTSNPTILEATTLPTLAKAMSDHYKSLVVPLPNALKIEFAKVYT